MAVRPIALLGAEILRQKGSLVEVFDEELKTFIDDMFQTMYHAEGVGLAAPQIGVSRRICVIDVRDDEGDHPGRIVLINPEVVEFSRETAKASEGCLSIPGLDEFVTRPARVTVRAQDGSGEFYEISAEGLFSRALQHEIDHLDGVLFIDRVSPLKRRMLVKKWKKTLEDDQ